MRFVIWLIIFSFFSIGLFSQALLKADGPGDTYELITSVLAPGYWPLETPDCSHESFGRHIDEVWDTLLNEHVFRFFLHVTPDNDRCINTDRQRNEIKVYAESPDSLKGFRGDRMIYEWVFRLDSFFRPSYSFTHIHQLKAVGGEEDGMPVITLTPRKASPDVLQLRYAESDEQVTLTIVPLSEIKGRWIRVREEVWYEEEGSYEITLQDAVDSTEIMHYRKDTIRMWRTGASFIRPKWGIYRSLNHADQLRDEAVLFNDFLIWKTSSLSAKRPGIPDRIILYPNPVTDILLFDLEDYPGMMFKRLYDLNGRLLRENDDPGLQQINVSSLSRGVYYLEFQKGPERLMRMFIKE